MDGGLVKKGIREFKGRFVCVLGRRSFIARLY